MVFSKRKPDAEDIKEAVFSCHRDGLVIRGTEYRPVTGKTLPAAIVCHGFMAYQDTVRHYAKALAQMGYAAYCFDFCGGCVGTKGKSDGKSTDMSVLTEVLDLEAVARYVRGLPYISGPILLMGCSQGGFVSALTAAKHPESVSKLVLFYPALCIPDDARAGKMMFAKFDPQNIPAQISCGPMKLGSCYPAYVIQMDPFSEIKSYSGPVLIVHGTKDRLVRPAYSRRAAEVYPNATLCMIEGGGHGFSKKHDRIALAALRTFLSA